MPKRRILIVEDEIVVVRGLEDALCSLGYTVCGFAPSGEKALSLVEQEKPHLALVDVQLRGKMDGTELAIVLSKRSHIPVVFITAFSNPEIVERAKLSGPYGYIVKPVRESQLKVCLELAFERIKEERERTAVDRSYLKTIEQLREQLAERVEGLEGASRKLLRAEGALHDYRLKLDSVQQELADLRGAFLALVRQMERSREDVEQEIAASIRGRILPILRELEAAPSLDRHKTELEMLFLCMSHISSGISREIPWSAALSTTELRVAILIRNGLTSEEIAKQLHLSLDTVKTHRRNIRKKLNLRNTDTNLITYLKDSSVLR